MKLDDIEHWKDRCRILATKNSRYKKQLRQMQKAYENLKFRHKNMCEYAIKMRDKSLDLEDKLNVPV